MGRSSILGVAFLMLVAALPLISIGTIQDSPAVWGVGLALLVAGALVPPFLRLVPRRPAPQEDEEEVGEAPC